MSQIRRWGTVLFLGCLATVGRAETPHSWKVESPDSGVKVQVEQKGTLTYSVSFHGQIVIAPSPLGLEFQGMPPLAGDTLKFMKVTESRADTSWQNPFGKHNPVRDHYRELRVAFATTSSSIPELDVVVRAYADGAAIRYELSGTQIGDKQDLVLTKEKTEFRFSSDPTVWAATYENFRHPYEREYPKAKLSSIHSSLLVGLPLLIQTSPSVFVGLAEADLTDWAAMYLKVGRADSQPNLIASLSPRLDGAGLVKIHTRKMSPWRVLMLGSGPGDLIESDLITNLNPPSAIQDSSWIHPGMMAWDHWWSGDVKMDTDTDKSFIQFAGEMGFAYQLVDWQWYGPFNTPDADITKPAPQVDMPELLRYAKERHVRLWLWLHSADVNRALESGKLEKAFALYQQWGVAGVKIDFMERDDQEMVCWYQTVVELAAKHHLMVDFHGAYKPTGLRRTWPNLMTREGVLGNEYNKFSGRVTPEHKLTLPFTRMLVGPMDFTPGGFLNRSPAAWKQTTPTEVMGSRAQELALFVVYESPLACVTDSPDNYHGQPGLEFLRDVPTVWDETRVLDGAVGKHIVVARRKGQDWFLGGMSGEDAYQLQLPLSFLGSGKYHVRIFADLKDEQSSYEKILISEREAAPSDVLPLYMRPAGGVAIEFKAEATK